MKKIVKIMSIVNKIEVQHITVTGEASVEQFTVNVAASPSAGGSVEVSSGSQRSPHSLTLDRGSNYNISTTGNTGYEFDKWTNNQDSSTNTSRTVNNLTLTENITWTANYEEEEEDTRVTLTLDGSDPYINKIVAYSGSSTVDITDASKAMTQITTEILTVGKPYGSSIDDIKLEPGTAIRIMIFADENHAVNYKNTEYGPLYEFAFKIESNTTINPTTRVYSYGLITSIIICGSSSAYGDSSDYFNSIASFSMGVYGKRMDGSVDFDTCFFTTEYYTTGMVSDNNFATHLGDDMNTITRFAGLVVNAYLYWEAYGLITIKYNNTPPGFNLDKYAFAPDQSLSNSVELDPTGNFNIVVYQSDASGQIIIKIKNR